MTDKLYFNLSNLGDMNDPFFVINKLKQVCQAIDELRSKKDPCEEDPLTCKEETKMPGDSVLIKMASDIIKNNFYNARFIKSENLPKKYYKGWEAIKAYSEGKKIRLKNSTYAFLILEDIISIKSLIENDWEIVE